jgi:hypothetical protein
LLFVTDGMNSTIAALANVAPSTLALPPLSSGPVMTRTASNQTPRGRLAEPTLVDVLPTSENTTRNAEWWSKKTPEECLGLLTDAQSGVGFADTKYWTPLQVTTIPLVGSR